MIALISSNGRRPVCLFPRTSGTRPYIYVLRCSGGCPLGFQGSVRNSPIRGAVERYRISQGRALHWLEAGLAAHLVTWAPSVVAARSARGFRLVERVIERALL